MKYCCLAFFLFSHINLIAQNHFPTTGFVGIGTTTPSTSLEIYQGNLRVSNPSGYPWGINLDVNYTGGWNREFSFSYGKTGKLAAFGAYAINGALTYAYIGGNTAAETAYPSPWVTFKPNGDIGIGTVNPTSRINIITADSTRDNFIKMENNGIINSLLYVGTANSSFPVTSYRNANVIESYNNFHISAANANSNLYFETGRLHETAPVRMIINNVGNVGIGTINPGTFKLAVEGTIGARKIKIQQASWADYVFLDNYRLPGLSEVSAFITRYKRLPDIPSEETVKREGIDVGEMNKLLLQKIEEQMLYIIQINEQMQQLSRRVTELENN